MEKSRSSWLSTVIAVARCCIIPRNIAQLFRVIIWPTSPFLIEVLRLMISIWSQKHMSTYARCPCLCPFLPYVTSVLLSGARKRCGLCSEMINSFRFFCCLWGFAGITVDLWVWLLLYFRWLFVGNVVVNFSHFDCHLQVWFGLLDLKQDCFVYTRTWWKEPVSFTIVTIYCCNVKIK